MEGEPGRGGLPEPAASGDAGREETLVLARARLGGEREAQASRCGENLHFPDDKKAIDVTSTPTVNVWLVRLDVHPGDADAIEPGAACRRQLERHDQCRRDATSAECSALPALPAERTRTTAAVMTGGLVLPPSSHRAAPSSISTDSSTGGFPWSDTRPTT
ncbi:hypothetical protein [Kribbella sp. VKM Ac-2571]|uniref:hypothetical protein n=1 Tax=Kribbella sp. VKM Ac-2571 TaxID=2512222 RepID=UPI001060D7B5|nr:hypothetical protein [Kribbella sp. VKM Ac-2571]